MSDETYYKAKWEACKIIGSHQDRTKGVLIDDDALEKLTFFLLSLPRWDDNYRYTKNDKKDRL